MELPIPADSQVSLLTIPLLFILFFVLAAGEEIGWMGYAAGSPAGTVECTKIRNHSGSGIGIGWKILIVWLYSNTGSSVFAAILFHAISNLGRAVFPADQIHNPLIDYPVQVCTLRRLGFLKIRLMG